MEILFVSLYIYFVLQIIASFFVMIVLITSLDRVKSRYMLRQILYCGVFFPYLIYCLVVKPVYDTYKELPEDETK